MSQGNVTHWTQTEPQKNSYNDDASERQGNLLVVSTYIVGGLDLGGPKSIYATVFRKFYPGRRLVIC